MPVPLTLLDYATRTSVIMHKPKQFKAKLKTCMLYAVQNWEAGESTAQHHLEDDGEHLEA